MAVCAVWPAGARVSQPAEGLDILSSDAEGPHEQSRQVSVDVFLRADVCEELGEAGLCIHPRRE